MSPSSSVLPFLPLELNAAVRCDPVQQMNAAFAISRNNSHRPQMNIKCGIQLSTAARYLALSDRVFRRVDGAGPELLVFRVVDFALCHVEKSDHPLTIDTGRFKHDCRFAAHDVPGHIVSHLKGLAVATADKYVVDGRRINSDVRELLGVPRFEERLKRFLVFRTAPIVATLVRLVEIREALNVAIVCRGEQVSRIAFAAPCTKPAVHAANEKPTSTREDKLPQFSARCGEIQATQYNCPPKVAIEI